MKILTLTFGIVLSTVQIVNAQWYFGPNLNYARYGLEVVENQGKIYAIGGWDGDQILEVFENNTWTLLHLLPQSQAGLAAAIVGNKIYTFGSYGWSNITQIYTINTNSWQSGPNIPQGLYWATAEAIGDSIYLIGGYSEVGALNTLYILNTATNTWSQGKNLPATIPFPASAVYGKQIYVFGDGFYFKYDIRTDSWISFPAPPGGYGYPAKAVSVGDKIYLIGRNAGYNYGAYKLVEIYDPIIQTWTMGPVLNIGRYQFGAIFMRDKIYVIGGRNENSQSINTVEILEVKIAAIENNCAVTPAEFYLYQNYPNPFNLSTIISYSIPYSADVTLKIYDMHGRENQTLINKFQNAGTYTLDFEATKLASGIYFYRLQIGAFVETKKMLLTR